MTSTVPLASFRLPLTGLHWHIHARDAEASTVVSALGASMSLSPAEFPSKPQPGERHREVYVFSDPEMKGFSSSGYTSGPIRCLLSPPINNDMLVLGMSFIALAIVRAELPRGGLLVHGALAQAPDHLHGGIILAGTGTVGKTTASNRLPRPWLSLSDDSSLVLPDGQGQYVAHPWPTWSRFYSRPDEKPGPGGKWAVQNGIPLKALFFLAQAKADRVTPLSSTPSVAYLMETVQHVSTLMTRYLEVDEIQSLYKKQFAAAEAIVRAIPSCMLHLSLTGTFWKLLEETLTSISTQSPSQTEQTISRENTQEMTIGFSSQELFGNNILTVSYSGTSMNPTLRHPDLLQVVPYAGRPIRVGDVIYYSPPTDSQKTIHRVIRITAKGIRTCGDNCSSTDPYLLQPADIIGLVTTAWRHDKPRKIAGGARGRWSRYQARISNRLDGFFSPILHGIYHRLASRGFLRYLLPASMQPRVFEFKQRHLPTILKLIVNGHVIGHYDVWKKHWFIARPWKLIMDETKLPIVSEPSFMESLERKNESLNNTSNTDQPII